MSKFLRVIIGTMTFLLMTYVILGCCTTFSIALSRLCGNQNLPRHPERPTRHPILNLERISPTEIRTD